MKNENNTLSTLDKATKAEAYGIVQHLRSGETVEPYVLDCLLNYFAPPLKTNPKNAFEWVALATDAKHLRPYARMVFVKDGVMTASDGHRMHWANTELEDGNYCPKTGLLLDDTTTPPNFVGVKIASKGLKSELVLNTLDIINSKHYKHPNFIKCNDVLGVNLNYIQQAAGSRLLGRAILEVDGQRVTGTSEYGSYIVCCVDLTKLTN